MENQLTQFGLDGYMNNITYVTDRGSNLIKAFRPHKALFCVAHRLNNILKRCFYQNPAAKKTTTSSDNISQSLTSITKIQETPKMISTTYVQASPEIEDSAAIINEDES